MDGQEPMLFHNDDHAYEEQVAQQGGYVLTRPHRDQYRLHDASCIHLGRDKRAKSPLENWLGLPGGAVTVFAGRCGVSPL